MHHVTTDQCLPITSSQVTGPFQRASTRVRHFAGERSLTFVVASGRFQTLLQIPKVHGVRGGEGRGGQIVSPQHSELPSASASPTSSTQEVDLPAHEVAIKDSPSKGKKIGGLADLFRPAHQPSAAYVPASQTLGCFHQLVTSICFSRLPPKTTATGAKPSSHVLGTQPSLGPMPLMRRYSDRIYSAPLPTPTPPVVLADLKPHETRSFFVFHGGSRTEIRYPGQVRTLPAALSLKICQRYECVSSIVCGLRRRR